MVSRQMPDEDCVEQRLLPSSPRPEVLRWLPSWLTKVRRVGSIQLFVCQLNPYPMFAEFAVGDRRF